MMNYKYHPKSILRTPLKPIKSSFSRDELVQFFKQDEAQEALFLASPDLLNKFIEWQNGELTDPKKEKKLVLALLKYAMRMHSRSTPFGLFASCGVVDGFSDKYTIQSSSAENVIRSTRLDMNFTCALAQELSKLPFIQKYLKFYPNTSIYTLQDKIRYVEYFYKDKRRIHQISAVDSSDYLQAIIDRSRNGATLDDLAKCIVDEEISYNEAHEFVHEIVSVQLLVSELDPAVTGDELLMQILNILKDIMLQENSTELRDIILTLEYAQVKLNQIDQKIGNNINVYKDLAETLKVLNIPFELSKLFQTDLFLQAPTSIQKTTLENEAQKKSKYIIQRQLTHAIEVLNKLTPETAKSNLTEFKKKFYDRFEHREVNLLEVLDTDAGLGYAQNTNQTGNINPLVNDLMMSAGNGDDLEYNWNRRYSFLFGKLIKAQQNGDLTVSLNAKELSDFETNWSDLPDSFSVMYRHLGQKNEKAHLSISSVGGSSAVNLLGRFASSNTEVEDLVTEIAAKEQENLRETILAEIAHLPESRTGNVIMRPSFRKFEIPYLSNSTLPEDQQIRLDDLYLSLKSNTLILRSKRLNKRIIPRLGNAHNYTNKALPVYHFLCDLQSQDKRTSFSFNWGSLQGEFSFLPRVEVDGVVISSACWQLRKKDYEVLCGQNITANVVDKWQLDWKLPNLFLLADGDNELLIDIKNELSVQLFISILKKRPHISLKEFLFDEESALVRDGDMNAYTNEFIALLQKEEIASQTAEKPATRVSSNLREAPVKIDQNVISRSFSLGSEWLYYKLYCGVKTSDTLLTEVLKPLIERLIEANLIDSWFFIRFVDPENHLRIRFHLNDLSSLGRVIVLIQDAISAYQENGLIWKVQTDTYTRELERYGANTMLFSEQIFLHDSNCTLEVLDLIDGDAGEEIRWLFAIRAVNELLDDFKYTLEQRRGLMEVLKTSFANEFNMDKMLKNQIDKKFRIHRKSISDVLDKANDESSEIQVLFTLLEEKSARIKPFVETILMIHQDQKLMLSSLNDLVASYIHMLLNRLFKNKQRMHELVVYDFMWRTYRSELARSKSPKKELVN